MGQFEREREERRWREGERSGRPRDYGRGSWGESGEYQSGLGPAYPGRWAGSEYPSTFGPRGYGEYGGGSRYGSGYGGEEGRGGYGYGGQGSEWRGYGGYEPERREGRHGGYGQYGEEREERGFFERMGDKLREGVRKLGGRGPKGYKRSDDRILDDVCERIARSWVDSENVEVKVSGGEVTLVGTVRSREEKRALEDITEDVFGVQDVDNRVKVDREMSSGTGYSSVSDVSSSTGTTGTTGTGSSGTGTTSGSEAGSRGKTPKTMV